MNGYPSEFIIGDLPQRKRQAIISKLKAGEAEYLVATDVAARGLHIDNLEMVINYDLPEDPEAYVHRIGRTARAGETGEAVAFACERYVFGLEAIEKLINQKIPVGELTEDLIGEDASAGMRIRTDRGAPRDNDRGRSGRGDARRDNRRGGRDGGRDSDHRRSESGRSDRGRGSTPAGKRPAERGEREPRGTERPRRPDTRRPDSRRPDNRRPDNRRGENVAPGQAPKANDSLEERLAYYRKKYGEDFQPTDEMLASMQDQSGSAGGSRKKRSRKGRS
ncbi:MAG: helicase-related protein, partial [Spirochaeta sp.]|nr:helicase-related protein [Spirochaeta sp.]